MILYYLNNKNNKNILFDDEVLEMQLSIIVPIYNVEKYLARCLTALSEIKEIEYEVILIDDGSTDGSSQICDCFAADKPNFHVFHIENAGVSNARNFGISKATGNYYTFVDADDYIKENIFKIMINATENGEIDIVQSNFIRVVQDKEEIIINHENILLEGGNVAIDKLVNPNKIISNSVWGKIYKRTKFKNIMFDSKIRIAEDLKYNFDCLLIAKSIKLIPYAGYCYVKREGSVMESTFSEKMLDNLKVNSYMINNSSNEQIKNKLLNYHLETMINLLYESEKGCIKNKNSYCEIKNDLIRQISSIETTNYIRKKYKFLRILIKHVPNLVLKIFNIYSRMKLKKIG